MEELDEMSTMYPSIDIDPPARVDFDFDFEPYHRGPLRTFAVWILALVLAGVEFVIVYTATIFALENLLGLR